jgi:hypothetical protein
VRKIVLIDGLRLLDMTLFPIMTIAALVFLLTALIATTVSAVVLYRLRRDRQWAEAAERHVRVDLQYLMKKHVPLARMTGMPTTELPIAKQNIARLLRLWKRIISASTALCIVGGILVTVGIRHELSSGQIEAVPKRAASVNPMADIVGTWGTPYNFAYSCSQNPYTMRLLDEDRRIVMTFGKPPGGAIPQSSEFLVVGTQKNEIVLSVPNEPRLALKLILDDKNSYHITRSDQPLAIFDIAARCPRDHASGSR